MRSNSTVLVTGAHGFFGKNIIAHFNGMGINSLNYTRRNSIQDLPDLIKKSEIIIHLAGENRPVDTKDFDVVNAGLTESICDVVRSTGKNIPIIFTSSVQANLDNPYGKSKLKAEKIIQKYKAKTGNTAYIFRLPRVFGKWCKPNYNSVVATFCYKTVRNLTVQVNDPSIELDLVHIDDVIEEFKRVMGEGLDDKKILSVQPEYKITISRLAEQIKFFQESGESLAIEGVSDDLVSKLYSTYTNYIP